MLDLKPLIACLALGSAILFPSVSGAAPAEEAAYPDKVVKIVMPFPPGGAGDVLARIVGNRLNEEWKQTVIVDNRAGASGTIGNAFVAKAPPDGYTLLMTITNVVQAPSLGQVVPYDILKDFVPLTRVANAPSIFVTNNSAIKSLKDYVALGSSAPDKLTYGTYGAGTTSHIYAELFNKRNKIQGVHVPYKGAAPLLNDMMGGQVDVAFVDLATALPFIQAGKIRAYAVVGDHRSPLLPDVPTFTEQGQPGLEVLGWYGMFAPGGTPPALAEKIRSTIEKVVRSPEGKKAITAMGLEPASGPREDFSRRLLADLVNWRRIIQEGGVKLD